MIDLVIAGAGPAGLATALCAARAGLDVIVVDPRPSPIDKACGEGLMPGAVTALHTLGVDPPGQPFRGIGYISGPHRAAALFDQGVGLGVRRTDLHAALVAAVRGAGVPILQRPVGQLTQDAGAVTADGVRARYLAAADGLHSPIARSLHLDAPARPTRPRWGQRRHFALAAWSDLVEVHWADHCEAYVTPVGGGLVGVAILSSHRAGFDEHLARFPELTAHLNGADAGPVRGAGPLRRRTISRVAARVLLVGDAAGYVDALTGEGIAVSLAGARALVECVASDRPEDYDRRWRQVSRRSRMLTCGLLWASSRPRLRRALVPAAERLPRAFSMIVGQLAH